MVVADAVALAAECDGDCLGLVLAEVIGEVARDRAEEVRCRAAELLSSLRGQHEQLASSIGGTDTAGDEAERLKTIDRTRETALGEGRREREVGRPDSAWIGLVDDREQVMLGEGQPGLALKVAVEGPGDRHGGEHECAPCAKLRRPQAAS